MTAFEKVRSLYTQLAAGGKVGASVYEGHLRGLFSEHEALLKSIPSKVVASAKKAEAILEEGLKKTGL